MIRPGALAASLAAVMAAGLAAGPTDALAAGMPAGAATAAAHPQTPLQAPDRLRISGAVTDAETNEPVPGVTIVLRRASDTARVAGTYTDLGGRFEIADLEPGQYVLAATSVGYAPVPELPVALASRASRPTDPASPAPDTVISILLTPVPIDMSAVVVSASRRSEKAVSAPGSVSVIDASEVAMRPAVTPVEHLRSTAGVDIAQTGLMQQTVVTRAFNNVFSTTLTMLTDNRAANVPSLRANIPSFIPIIGDDIDRIELVRGPGSALYGPNANNGVMNIITRHPAASRGTTLSASGGSQSTTSLAFRHAGTAGEFGYKASGSWFRGSDWEFDDPAEQFEREDIVERWGGEARFDWDFGGGAAVLTGGLNRAVRTIEMTDIGAAQGKDWTYGFVQGRVSAGDFFAQGYLNTSDAGSSYLLRTGQPIVDRSKYIVGQLQHAASLGGAQRFTYGLDMNFTRPVTDGTINGRNEADDDIDEVGAYLQSETQLSKEFAFIAAARLDYHNRLDDPVFSPRAAIVWTVPDRSVRLTYNRAYSTPNTVDLFLDILAQENVFGLPAPYSIDLRGSGIPEGGYTFARDSAGRPFMHSFLSADPSVAIPVDDVYLLWPDLTQALLSLGIDLTDLAPPTAGEIRSSMEILNSERTGFEPVSGVADIPGLVPTITQTMEAGYKGLLTGDLALGVDVYYMHVKNFIGQFQIITPNVFMNTSDLFSYLLSEGVPSTEASFYAAIIGGVPLATVTPEGVVDPTAIVVTSRNFGRLTLWGTDISLEYTPSAAWSFGATWSAISENYFEDLEPGADLALNTPRNRASGTVRYRHGGFHGEARVRGMDGFRMSSGVYAGHVESYVLIDLLAGAEVPWVVGLRATLAAENVLDDRHREFVGAPELGRLVTGRLHYTF